MSFKNAIGLFGIYIIIGLVLFVTESYIGQTDMHIVGVGITCIAKVFFLFTLGEMVLTEYMRKKNPDYLSSVIIGAKSLRLLLTLFAIVIYGILKVPELIIFCCNIFIFYIITLIYTTTFNLLKNKP